MMGLGLTILVALVILITLVLGYFRDVRRAIIALAGTMFGIVLVTHWAGPTAVWLAEISGGNAVNLMTPMSIIIFLATVIVIGYGSPVLVGKNTFDAKTPLQRRLSTSALGVVNGIMIAGSLLRYYAGSSDERQAEVTTNPLTNYLYTALPLLLLLFALAIAALVGWKSFQLARLGQNASAKAPAKPEEKKDDKGGAPAPGATAAAGAERK